jgi:hypothetical protein
VTGAADAQALDADRLLSAAGATGSQGAKPGRKAGRRDDDFGSTPVVRSGSRERPESAHPHRPTPDELLNVIDTKAHEIQQALATLRRRKIAAE